MSVSRETMTKLGSGIPVNLIGPVEGLMVQVEGPDQTLALLDQIESGEVDAPIVLVHEAGGTTIGPLLGSIAGIVSTEGGIGSHIAILAKEYGCACVVGAQLVGDPTMSRQVLLDSDGSIYLAENDGSR